MSDVPVIDRERLDRVCMGNPALAGEFIDMLIEEATPLVAGLPALVSSNDAGAVRESAHSVKGIAGNVGAARLQAASRLLEEAAVNGEPSAVLATLADGIVAALNELRAERDTVS